MICPICNRVMIGEHKCPPKFEVSSEFSKEIKSFHVYSAEEAANSYAEDYDNNNNYNIMRGERMHVIVKNRNGEEKEFDVYGYIERRYSALELPQR